jgi:hypothetical protein
MSFINKLLDLFWNNKSQKEKIIAQLNRQTTSIQGWLKSIEASKRLYDSGKEKDTEYYYAEVFLIDEKLDKESIGIQILTSQDMLTLKKSGWAETRTPAYKK